MRVGVSRASPNVRFAGEGRGVAVLALRQFDHAAHQRKAVRMQAVGGEADDDIADLNRVAGEHRVALDRANREAREVIITRRIEPRHLGGLAADQRTTGGPAPLGNAGDDLARHLGIEPSRREIVEEEQRFGAGDDDVVDTHRHQIDADRVVAADRHGDHELGADTIGAGDQQRVAVARLGEVEKPAESTERGIGTGARGRPCQRLDRLDQTGASGDVDARLFVCDTDNGPLALGANVRYSAALQSEDT